MSSDELHVQMHKETNEQLEAINTRLSRLEGKLMATAAFTSLVFTLVSAWVTK
jgi:hypothetical protein